MKRSKALLGMALGALAGPATALSTQYEVSFEARWTADLPRPGNAHFTTLVGATHNASGSLLTIGQAASAGVEQVAEVGGTSTLSNEVQSRITAGHADQLVLGTDGFISPEETNTFTIDVDDNFPLLTLITMIAPSPDWFTGVHGLSLVDLNGGFIPQLVLDLPSYDAGTEDGTGLSLSNPPTNPQGVITMLDVAEPNGALFGAGSIARLTLTRVLAEDLDGDGDVDDADFGVAFAAFTGPNNGPPSNPAADLDNDGDVDDADFGLAFAAFTGPGSAAAVPEPGTLAGMALLAGAVLCRRQR